MKTEAGTAKQPIKVGHILLKIVTWLLVAFTVGMMLFTVITVTTVDKSNRSIFGMKMLIVQSDSMSRSEKNADFKVHFRAGDIIFIKNVKDPASMQAGDVVAFISTNKESYGDTVTHAIREVKKDESGRVLGYVTYGTNTGTSDEALVAPEYILGKYAGRLPGLGRFFAFVKTTPGYIVCILVPFLLLILYNGVNVIRLFRKYKKEQTEEMQAERAKIEEERAENQRMMAELLELKAQLAKEESEPPAPEETPAEETEKENVSVENTEENR